MPKQSTAPVLFPEPPEEPEEESESSLLHENNRAMVTAIVEKRKAGVLGIGTGV